MVERFSGEWRSVKLGEVVSVKRGKRVVRSQLSRFGKFPAFQNSLTPLGYSDRKNCPPESAFLIAGGNAGDAGFCDSAFWAADDCYYFVERECVHQKFLYYVLIRNHYYLHTQARRTTIPRLSPDIIENITISLPPLDEQIAIADTLSAFDRHLANLSELIAKHEGIRAGALEDLLSGRTRLPGFSGEWRTVKLLDKVKLLQGLTYKSEEVDVFGTLVLRSSNVQNNRLSLNDNVYVRTKIRSEKMIQKGDILVCVRNGSAKLIGKSCVLPEMPNTTFGAFMSVLRGDTTGFIAKVFESSIVQRQLRGRTRATIHQITKKDFEGVIIPLPPVDEQIAIAETLSALDLNITNLKAEHAKISALRIAAINDLLTGNIRLERSN